MLRRNLDAVAIAIVCLGMAIVSHIPPPGTATAKAIRLQNAVLHNPCTLLESILSRIQ